MNSTLAIASRLLALLRRRQYVDEASWLAALRALADVARHEEISLPLRKAKQVHHNPNKNGSFANTQDVVDFCQRHKLTLPHREHWWFLVKGMERTGYIHALDNSRGYPRITNGIDVWIERADGTLFKGHRDWLRWDRRPKDLSAKPPQAASQSRARVSSTYLTKAHEISANNKVDSFAERFAQVVGKPPFLEFDDVSGNVLIPSLAGAIATYMEKVTSI